MNAAAYLKKKRELIAGTLLFLLLSGLISFLYGYPAAPFLYEALLTVTLLGVYLAAGYPSYRRKIRELEQMCRLAQEQFYHPQRADSAEEALYQQALDGVCQKRQEQENFYRQSLEEAQRYYALWSHQIKTPLAALRLLQQEEQPDRRAMEQELIKAEQYVEMALQYQRLNGKTDDLKLRRLALLPVVHQAVKKTAPLFIYKKLRVSIAEMNQTVVSDEKWLVFVLEQILTNAVKYTNRGSVSIYMAGKELVVEDTGIGILAEDLPRVFEWGYTGFNGRLDKHSTGIGLSLCRQMTAKLGHEIRMESEPGAGTKVFLKMEKESSVRE